MKAETKAKKNGSKALTAQNPARRPSQAGEASEPGGGSQRHIVAYSFHQYPQALLEGIFVAYSMRIMDSSA